MLNSMTRTDAVYMSSAREIYPPENVAKQTVYFKTSQSYRGVIRSVTVVGTVDYETYGTTNVRFGHVKVQGKKFMVVEERNSWWAVCLYGDTGFGDYRPMLRLERNLIK